MPLWIQIYILIFSIMFITNIIHQIKNKIRFLLLLYEVLSAVYLISLLFVYWVPYISSMLNLFIIIPLIFVIGTDICLTSDDNLKKFGLTAPNITHKEFEIVKAFSLIFAAPCYIVGILISCKLICQYFNITI